MPRGSDSFRFTVVCCKESEVGGRARAAWAESRVAGQVVVFNRKETDVQGRADLCGGLMHG